MKRLIAMLLAAALLLTAVTVYAEADETAAEPTAAPEETSPEATEEPVLPERDYGVLSVGNPTPMDGKFFTTMWGNATSDIDVRTLVNSYYLTVWGYDTGIFVPNPVTVRGNMIFEDDQNGDRDYVFVLYDDLYYSDGTQITAWDYAFTALFEASPVISELGGQPTDLSYLRGYEEYVSGETPYFSGVRVTSDNTIEFTVKGECLPYFFELFRLGFLPYPIHEIAPGCKVYDDGEGVYIGNEDPTIEQKVFTVDLLRSTVMDPEDGYLSHPTVGSGPYRLTSWDNETLTCTFEINPYFKGNEEGFKPTIPTLRYTLAKNETMLDLLREDEFQLLNKVTRKDTIEGGIRMVASGGYTMSQYPRIGLSFIVFTPDMPALQEMNVRKAINYCMDKSQLEEEYTAAYGLTMDGLIGIGQWMYQLAMGTTDYPVVLPENATPAEQREYEEKIEAWEALNLDGLVHYDLDVDKAVKLLEENGWTLNENGSAFRPGTDEIRCKQIGGELVRLDLTCAYPETNIMAESMETFFVPYLKEAGIRLTLLPKTMKDLLRSYNDKDVEGIDMFYLGDDFNIEFDPQLFFLANADPDMPKEDSLAWVHTQMAEYAYRMCRTEPGDAYGFIQKWITFQEQLSDMLPLIPVYSNVYFDFYVSDLTNYDIIKYITWGDAIVPAEYSYHDPAELEAPEENSLEDELTDDESEEENLDE